MNAYRLDQPAVLVALVATVPVVGLRFAVPGHGLSWPGTYEAFAHIWCGYMIGLVVLAEGRPRRAAGFALVAASLFELVKFLLR